MFSVSTKSASLFWGISVLLRSRRERNTLGHRFMPRWSTVILRAYHLGMTDYQSISYLGRENIASSGSGPLIVRTRSPCVGAHRWMRRRAILSGKRGQLKRASFKARYLDEAADPGRAARAVLRAHR